MELSAATRNAILHLPENLQAPANRWFERLAEQGGMHAADDILPHLARVVACSEFAGNTLLRYWSELEDRLQDLNEPVDQDALRLFADSAGDVDNSTDFFKAALRRQRNLRLLHVFWRELAGAASVDDSLQDLSDTADQLLRAATAFAHREMSERFGRVRDAGGREVSMIILAMGKLGGRELNFSSDIDLIFCYSASGESDGRKRLHAQEYFDRLSRQIVQLIDASTADGFVFRTDTRLRPFGESGPPVVSFAALESYLLRHGRDWERYAYVKARIVGSRPLVEVSTELFDELIFPFVYRRYLDYGVFESLREMHAMIATEVARKELADNVKLGPGGIREIEFIVQSLQLVRGGSRNEFRQLFATHHDGGGAAPRHHRNADAALAGDDDDALLRPKQVLDRGALHRTVCGVCRPGFHRALHPDGRVFGPGVSFLVRRADWPGGGLPGSAQGVSDPQRHLGLSAAPQLDLRLGRHGPLRPRRGPGGEDVGLEGLGAVRDPGAAAGAEPIAAFADRRGLTVGDGVLGQYFRYGHYGGVAAALLAGHTHGRDGGPDVLPAQDEGTRTMGCRVRVQPDPVGRRLRLDLHGSDGADLHQFGRQCGGPGEHARGDGGLGRDECGWDMAVFCPEYWGRRCVHCRQ